MSSGVGAVVGVAVVFCMECVGDGGGLNSGVAPDGAEAAVLHALARCWAGVGGAVVVVGVVCNKPGAAAAGGA